MPTQFNDAATSSQDTSNTLSQPLIPDDYVDQTHRADESWYRNDIRYIPKPPTLKKIHHARGLRMIHIKINKQENVESVV